MKYDPKTPSVGPNVHGSVNVTPNLFANAAYVKPGPPAAPKPKQEPVAAPAEEERSKNYSATQTKLAKPERPLCCVCRQPLRQNAQGVDKRDIDLRVHNSAMDFCTVVCAIQFASAVRAAK